jgi:asparagine synthetase B (glutamine-hydrolysing)
VFFSICICDDTGESSWQDVVRRHAAWLGADVRLESLAASDGNRIHVAWAAARFPEAWPNDPDASGYLPLTPQDGVKPIAGLTTEEHLRRWLTDEHSPVEIRVGVSLRMGELLAAVPPVSLEQLCFARVPGGWTISNDLRFLARLVGADLDERGVYGLFRHGIVLPPMTLFSKIQCVPAGHLLKIAPGSEAPVLEVFFHLSPPAAGPPQTELAESKVRNTLDEILASTPASSIVYFSGGMDSSLIAARLAAMGRADATLVNCAFGPQDEAGQKALKIAAHLGLRCEQFMWNPSGIPAVLERLGKDYPIPFGDPSLIPGNLLAHASLPLAEASRMAIHGVGTGGMFGQRMLLRKKQKRFYRIPRPFRRAIGETYRWFGLWRHVSEAEHAIGFLRRSLEMPIVSPPRPAHHPMEGIAYTVPKTVNARLMQLVRYHSEAFAPPGQRVEGLLGLNLHLQRQFSAIAAGPLGASGMRTLGAFTEPRMLRYAFSLQSEEKCPGGVPRGLLNNLLSKSLPSEYIYVPGRSFIAPFRAIYEHPAMRSLVNDVVLSRQNPLLDFCNVGVVSEMLARVQGGRPVSIRARQFLWTFVFSSLWLRQSILLE